MEKLTIDSYKSNSQKPLYILWSVLGAFYLVAALINYSQGSEIDSYLIIQFVMGLVILIIPFAHFNKDNPRYQLRLNHNNIRMFAGDRYIRSAHWKHIDTIEISPKALHIHYQSGSSERFNLPAQYQDLNTLKSWLKGVTSEHDIHMNKAPWWKSLFTFRLVIR